MQNFIKEKHQIFFSYQELTHYAVWDSKVLTLWDDGIVGFSSVYVCIYQTFTLWHTQLNSNVNKVYFSHTFPKGIFDDGVFPIC